MSAAAPIDFYFDFSSPYGYLASTQIDALAERHGRTVTWRPFLLGAVFQHTGSQPLLSIPMKNDYAMIDMPRMARLYGVPIRMPSTFPFMAVPACRAFYWLVDQGREDTAKAFARAMFKAAFVDDRPVASPSNVVEIAGEVGVDGEALAAALKDPAMKSRLREEVDAAIARNVFGSPYIVVDGEPFWGADHLPLIERGLETGGW